MLLVFTALIYMFNYFLFKIGDYTMINDWVAANTSAYDKLSFQFILGYLFAPISWLIGVPYADIVTVGQLLGEKTILNEFYAYATMGEMKATGVFSSEKSMIMSTYILCGFSNVASIGIQIGGIGALIPEKRGLLSKLGVKALVGGTVASLFTAAVVGMFFS
jgi:CNT family concentrative nucleoside transporter